MCIQLGYPNEQAERLLLEGQDHREKAKLLKTELTLDKLTALQQQVNDVKVSSSVLDYLQRIIAFTRYEAGYQYGLSPRGALALLRSAKAWAVVNDEERRVGKECGSRWGRER